MELEEKYLNVLTKLHEAHLEINRLKSLVDLLILEKPKRDYARAWIAACDQIVKLHAEINYLKKKEVKMNEVNELVKTEDQISLSMAEANEVLEPLTFGQLEDARDAVQEAFFQTSEDLPDHNDPNTYSLTRSSL